MAASDLVDEALVAALAADSTLAGLAPDGVWMDEAPPGLERFVIVSLAESLDLEQFNGRAFESCLYLVKVVTKGTDAATARAAAARIDDLLDQGTVTFTGSPPPYALEALMRESRLAPQVEVDEGDPSIRWQHRGGYYRMIVAPLD